MTGPTGPGTSDRPGPQMFPTAATPADDRHPPACPCGACTDALLVRLSRPLVPPGSLTDPALVGGAR